MAWDGEGVRDGWAWYRPELVRADLDDARLAMTCLRESAWYRNSRGPMLFRRVAGDGAVSVTVRTRKASDAQRYPDDQWQFGGVILRDPGSDAWLASESYVFNAVGHRFDRLAIEAKSTRHGYSEVLAHDWDSGDAELSVDRRGASFTMRARSAGAEQWTDVCNFDRPDLPPVLQLGIMAYAYSVGKGIFDVRAEFGGLDVAFSE